MSTPTINKESPIVVVGAGVFGLSTAIHLARRGYRDVTIFDKQPYEETLYSYEAGCDAASADMNKVMRAAYGAENAEIKTGENLPPGFTADDVIFVNNGSLELNSKEGLTRYQLDSIANMSEAGFGHTQVVLTDAQQVARATQEGFGFAINPFGRPPEQNYGTLDTMAGFVYADKACRFALHTAKTLDVKTVLGGEAGQFASFVRDCDSKLTGIRTADGSHRSASLVVMACGGWTPSCVPQLDSLCETTGGSVSIFKLPAGSSLWTRFAPENFPTWAYDLKLAAHGGLYGFPRDPRGYVKIGYRGTKYTNPQPQGDGRVRSVPITRWTGEKSMRQIPQPAAVPAGAGAVRGPDAAVLVHGLVRQSLRGGLCAGRRGVGHGRDGRQRARVSFLADAGKYVVDRIEGMSDGVLKKWQWRSLKEGQTPINRLMEGPASGRALQNQRLTAEDSLQAS